MNGLGALPGRRLEEDYVTTPPMGPGPAYYAEPLPYPPLDHTADRPPYAPAPSGLGAGKVIGLLAAAGLIAVTAGTIGGGVGYLIARETLPKATVAEAVAASGPAAAPLPSVVPGSIADIAAKVQPAVVQLNVDGPDGGGTGSGFVISDDGYIVTNNHVAGTATKIEVTFADGSTETGTLVGANPGYDLAVVKVNKTGLPTVTIGSSADLSVGDSVIAVGSPLGLSGTVTTGIVSALNRPVSTGVQGDTAFINAIQTDAAINPGNSGGPLLDGNGEVIGVNSAIASMGSDGTSQPGSIGLGFAIPIDTAKRIADEIVKTGSSSTPIIGVQLNMQATGPGATIGDVTAGGAADSAGLLAGDVVTAVDGNAIEDATDLIVTIRDHAPGDTLTLTVTRDGKSLDLPVTLGATTS